MQSVFKNIATCIVCFVVIGIVISLLFTKHVVDIQTGRTTMAVYNHPTNSQSEHTPWYAFLFADQRFLLVKDEAHVLLKHEQSTFTSAPVKQVMKRVFSSPVLLLLVMVMLLLMLNKLRELRQQHARAKALTDIDRDLKDIISGLEIDYKALPIGGSVAQISHAVHTIASNIQRIKIKTDSHVFQDKLTKLIDRHAYIEHISNELAMAEQQQSKCGLLFIDLDGFKQVNDSFGHSFGDEILIQVAERLCQVVRQYQLQALHAVHGLDQNLSRLGGDEFSIFIPELKDTGFCTEVAQTILGEIERDFVLGNKLVKISASIGIAVYPDSAATPNALLQMSDVAMYRAKTDGRGIFRVYSPEMGNKIRR
ncbi:diguanylate phosphodiesterase, partial [Pseudoalteromonas rubra]